MSKFKTYGTIAVMIACFAVVYPRFMHPLVLRLFGSQPELSKNADDLYPPGFRGAQPSMKPSGSGDKDDVRRHIRPGPHPGMRAAAEMHRQQAQQGSGRGMMGVVLPMYAVGIVLYLGYTLFKVFNRGDQKNNHWGNKRDYYNRKRGYSPQHDRMGFPSDFDGTHGDIKDFLQDEDQRRNLEDLLTRVDDKNVSVEEMRLLQKRLEETEAQMTRILKAMHNVQANVDNIADNQMPTSSEENGNKTQNMATDTHGEKDIRSKDKDPETRTEDTIKSSPIIEETGEVSSKMDGAVGEEGSEMDRAGREPDSNALDDTEEENNSVEDGSENEETNDAFDVEEEDEDDQVTDEIIPDKSNQGNVDNDTARHRNVTVDKKQ